MSVVDEKIKLMGYSLPEPPKSMAAYVPGLQVQNLIYVSGQIPIVNGELKYKGKVGKELDTEQASCAARICALNCLSVIKSVAGELDSIRIIKLTGFVNSTSDFSEQHLVVNGASEFLQEVLGLHGSHTRSAIGVAALPLNAPVEIEMIVEIVK